MKKKIKVQAQGAISPEHCHDHHLACIVGELDPTGKPLILGAMARFSDYSTWLFLFL